MRIAVLAGLVLCSFTATNAGAQDRLERDARDDRVSVREAATSTLRPGLREKVVMEDSASVGRTRRVAEGRRDAETGVYRARYRIRDRIPAGLSSEAAALEHLRRSARAYGIEADDAMVVEHVRAGRSTYHVRLRQTLAGVPVYRRHVTVSLNDRRQPTMVVSGYATHLDRVTSFDPVPRIGRDGARRIVETAAEGGLETTAPELVVFPSDPPVLAWKIDASSRLLPVSWEVLVDARTGAVIQMLDVSLHAYGTVDLSALHTVDEVRDHMNAPGPIPVAQARPVLDAAVVDEDGAGAPAASRRLAAVARDGTVGDAKPDDNDLAGIPSPEPVLVAANPGRGGDAAARRAEQAEDAPKGGRRAVQIDGVGYVFDPDPLTSAGVSYGGDFVDGDDRDTQALTGQLFTVPLREITQGSDHLYRLDGPYVRIEGDSATVPAEPSPDAFTYTRADDHFEAVNAYYHVDKSQRYVQTLDVGFPIKDEPVRVDPRAFDRDDSNYNAAQDLIRFGTGGIDDAEDADVIWHEYAHVLLNFTTPGLAGDFEGRALHEGWADYWAASYSRFLSEEDPQIPEHDWRRVFTWDGNLPCWNGRTLDHSGHYDDDMSYFPPGCDVMQEEYQWGLLWATTLMDIYPRVGRGVLDRLNLASHAYLTSTSTFIDAAEALIQADYDLYEGVHSSVLVEELGEAGYIDPLNFGPLLSHEPLAATENVGGTVLVEVEAQETTAPVDNVIVYHAFGDGSFDTLVLERVSGDVYEGELPLPGEPDTVRYYVEAVDDQGRRRRLPTDAPAQTFTFEVGTDRTPPVVRHDPTMEAAVIAWPIDVYAEVSDNLGVDSVWVQYVIAGPGGGVYAEGAFGLAAMEGVYSGRFPEPPTPVREGDAVRYRVFARDAAAAGNVAALPDQGQYAVEIVEGGLLRSYDFERISQGLVPTGVWAAGSPSYTLRVARSGENVWATRPADAYPDTTGLSVLELPEIDLDGLGPTYLIFWHWYDFEHDGRATPGAFNELAGIWDGANVKVSTAGEPWQVVEPEGGYNGTIGEASGGNPLSGEPGFGGYSYGWRREIVRLPSANGVRIRFEFGADGRNDREAIAFAGWYIDDVSITTDLPQDSEAPSAQGLPPDRLVRVPGQDLTPSASIDVADETGIEAVLSEYQVITDDGTMDGSLRLAMSGTDASIYEGELVPVQTFMAGDRIEYTLVLRDFDGNEARYGDPFVVDYRAEQRTTALGSVVATGAWEEDEGLWTASGGASAAGAGVSSLVLEPFTVATNTETSRLILDHQYALSGGAGGNVKVSINDGAEWTVLSPEGGYVSTFDQDSGHPMAAEPVFSGASGETTEDVFNLTTYRGRTLRMRIDFGQARALDPAEAWSITGISYRSLSADEEFQTDRELAIHANFPDPFADRTTISYSLPGSETMAARLSVYDILGRRVQVIRHAQHEPGTYTITYDARNLSNGVYILYLETPRGIRSERMVVLR